MVIKQLHHTEHTITEQWSHTERTITEQWCHTERIVTEQWCHTECMVTDSGVTLRVWLQNCDVTQFIVSSVTLTMVSHWMYGYKTVVSYRVYSQTVMSHWQWCHTVYGYRAVVSHSVHSQHTKATHDTQSRVLKSVHIIPGLSFPVLLASMNVVINFCTVSSSQLDLNSRWTWGNTHTQVSLCGGKKGHAILCFKGRHMVKPL